MDQHPGVPVKGTRFLTLACLAGLCSVVSAGDGRIELSQPMMPVTITQSGSYVLTEDLSGIAGEHGIVIESHGVTLDLNGFALIGSTGALDGVHIPAHLNVADLEVRNGVIREWPGAAVAALTTTNSVLVNLVARNNLGDGLNIGFGSRVTGCRAVGNGPGIPLELNTNHFGTGIEVENGSLVEDCLAMGNNDHGLDVHSGTLVRNCTVLNNVHDGIHGSHAVTIIGCTARGNSEGIEVDSGSVILRCSVAGNREDGIRGKRKVEGGGAVVLQCTAFENTLDGIDVAQGSLAAGNTSLMNQRHGIRAEPRSRILGNVSHGNAERGIKLAGEGSLVRDNVANDNFEGIRARGDLATNNMIIANTARGNDDDYDILMPGNHFQEVNNPGADLPQNPWINFDL
jgi:hypothetical protein